MILRQPRGQAVNKPPSEDDRKPHWGACTCKPIHIHSGRAKGSIICFPCSQKFMSDGLAIGAYPLPARFLPGALRGGAEPGRTARFPSDCLKKRIQIFTIDGRFPGRRREYEQWKEPASTSLFLVWSQSVPVSHRSPQHAPGPSPPCPSTVEYWLRDNGPLVECIYYASVVDNPPKWASKRWLVDVFSNFSSSPWLPHH